MTSPKRTIKEGFEARKRQREIDGSALPMAGRDIDFITKKKKKKRIYH